MLDMKVLWVRVEEVEGSRKRKGALARGDSR